MRKLISYANDKLRFEARNKAALYEADPELRVRVSFDKAAKTLTIPGNGIGLSQLEAIDNPGTITKSGTPDFMESFRATRKTMRS